MDGILQFIQTHLPALVEHKYLFLFIGVATEGLNSAILAGFLASIGVVAVWPTFFLCVAGQILNCYAWYAVGYFAGSKPIDKWGRKDEKSRRIIEKVENYFHRYSGRAILIAHLTWSFTIATMIMAGSFKYHIKKFSFYNTIGSFLWVVIIFSLGYFFGQSYKLFLAYIKGFLFATLFLVGAIVIAYLIKFIFGSAFIKSLFLTDKIKEFSHKMRNGLGEFLSTGPDDKEE